MAAELCTKLHVQTAVLRLKSRSSQLRADRSIVEPATRNIDGTRLISRFAGLEPIVFFSLVFSRSL